MQRPYWQRGEELCEHCLQVFVYEEEYRCCGCDGSVCRDCVVLVRESMEVYCPQCPCDSAVVDDRREA